MLKIDHTYRSPLLLCVQALQLGTDLGFDIVVEHCHQVLPHHLFDGPLVAISCLQLVGKVGEVLFVSLADAFCPLVVKLKAGLRQRLFELRHQLDQLRWGLKLFKSLEERFLQLG